jgi:SAM-dependent methyltransferase
MLEDKTREKLNKIDRDHFWRHARRDLLLEWIGRLFPGMTGLEILDIGGSCTFLSHAMRHFGKITVIEPNREMVAAAQEIFGLEVREGFLPWSIPVPGPYDFITALDVLEHIDDDGNAVKTIFQLLKPGGVFLCTVAATPCLWGRHDESVGHKRRYTAKTLRRVLENTDFKVPRISYYGFSLFPFTFLHRCGEKLMRSKGAEEYTKTMPPIALNKLLYAWMSVDRYLLRFINLPIGSSLIAVAIKADSAI